VKNKASTVTPVFFNPIVSIFKTFIQSPFNMPMFYKQGAQKVKPTIFATPNVFLEDIFTRFVRY
jgi:hypothetical protein